jgi:hypothetical protein
VATYVEHYEAALTNIRRARERAEIITTLSIEGHAKLKDEIEQICADAQALADGLGRL